MSEEIMKSIVTIKFKNNSKGYTFMTDLDNLDIGDYVVVETAQGLELGMVTVGLRDSSTFNNPSALKPVLRKATYEDRMAQEENIYEAKRAFDYCQSQIDELQLDMHLISAEYTLDKKKILIVYLADQRVDFRELLKRLAAELHCRIELKQIGDRDKAKLVGGIGVCGRELCCAKFMTNFDVVGINNAKNQLLALNATKLSGQCGKLMCCLRFEDEVYKEMIAGLPKMNSQVMFRDKIYRLTGMNVLTNYARLENKEEVLPITVDELRKEGKPFRMEPPKKKDKTKNDKTEKL